MRYVKPLSPEAWKEVMEHLERGPSQRLVDFIEKSEKMEFNEED